MRATAILCSLVSCVSMISAYAQAPREQPEAISLIAAAARVLEGQYAVARSLTVDERVALQPLTLELRNDGRERRLDYRLRTEWEAGVDGTAPVPVVHRELRAVDGRQPRDAFGDGCLLPEAPDPLSFLLPAARSDYRFGLPARGRQTADAGRIVIEYEPVKAGHPSLRWVGDCGSLDLPGMVRGRLTLDTSTSTVRRLEQELVSPVTVQVPLDQRRDGMGSSISVERLEAIFEYAPIRFSMPDEVLVLPVRTTRVTVVRTPEPRALRVTQRFTDYRRFSTDARVGPVR